MRKAAYLAMVLLGVAATTVPAMGQGYTTNIEGKVTLKGEPVPDAQVVLTHLESGRSYKIKTNKKGEYQIAGVLLAAYEFTVFSKTGECLLKQSYPPFNRTGGVTEEVDIVIGEAGQGCIAGAGAAGRPASAKDAKKNQAKADATNASLAQARDAIGRQDWPAAENALQEALKSEPDHWEFYVALGGAQENQGKYPEALHSYDTGIEKAQKTQPDPKNPYSDPVKIKTGIAQMLLQEARIYMDIKKPEDAAKTYLRVGDSGYNPATAYYNACAVYYNMGRGQDAVAACDKSIAADQNKADAYFLKGSVLVNSGRLDSSGKRYVSAAAVEALKKYLELAPSGSHAAEAKQLLDSVVVGS